MTPKERKLIEERAQHYRDRAKFRRDQAVSDEDVIARKVHLESASRYDQKADVVDGILLMLDSLR